jgi:transcriptional regulator with XRE-family HTH domain
MNYWLNTRKLKDIRKARELTQADLAEIIGVTEGRVSHYETGKRKLWERTVNKIGVALGFSVEELILPDVRERNGEKRGN